MIAHKQLSMLTNMSSYKQFDLFKQNTGYYNKNHLYSKHSDNKGRKWLFMPRTYIWN